jgi:hypothetical protein
LDNNHYHSDHRSIHPGAKVGASSAIETGEGLKMLHAGQFVFERLKIAVSRTKYTTSGNATEFDRFSRKPVNAVLGLCR